MAICFLCYIAGIYIYKNSLLSNLSKHFPPALTVWLISICLKIQKWVLIHHRLKLSFWDTLSSIRFESPWVFWIVVPLACFSFQIIFKEAVCQIPWKAGFDLSSTTASAVHKNSKKTLFWPILIDSLTNKLFPFKFSANAIFTKHFPFLTSPNLKQIFLPLI